MDESKYLLISADLGLKKTGNESMEPFKNEKFATFQRVLDGQACDFQLSSETTYVEIYVPEDRCIEPTASLKPEPNEKSNKWCCLAGLLLWMIQF
jgi:hypothetical protein